MGPLAEIQRPSSFHPTALFLDGHRRPRLYRTCILSQSISLFKYPSELSAKPHWGEASGHFDPQIVRTNPEVEAIRNSVDTPVPSSFNAGKAVTAIWSNLPQDVQLELFEH